MIRFAALALLAAACGGDTPMLVFDAGVSDATGHCDPLGQTGCRVGEKCTWITDQDDPPIGHVGCAPDGALAVGSPCTAPIAGPDGYDACVKGAVCLSGECKLICDHQGGLPACAPGQACGAYALFLEEGGTTIAGVCDPTCDPLTQELTLGARRAACGSANPAMPSKGCYGYESFTCSPADTTTWTLIDRAMPQTNSAGRPYLNGCAPGYMPLVVETTGSMTTLCTGLCAALETDNRTTILPGETTAHADNDKGDAAASAKLPTDPVSAPGNATCGSTQKGSEVTSVCKFLWPALIDTAGNLTITAYTDTLGYCVALAHYNYDHDGLPGTANVGVPNCNTLPPRSPATPGTDDDAADWGCQKVAHAMFTAPTGKTFPAPELHPALRDVRVVGFGGQLVRHRVVD